MPQKVQYEDLFKKLKQHLLDNPQHKEAVKEGILIFNKEIMYLRGHYCDLCDKRLTQEEIRTISMYHPMITCLTHREHGDKFDIDRTRKFLNPPPRSFFLSDFIDSL